MNLKTINITHIRLISLYWSRFAVRSGSGLVYLMIALVFGLSVAHIIIMPVERLMALQKKQTGQTNPQAINKAILDIGQPIIQFVLGIKTFEQVAKEAAVTQMSPPIDTSTSAQSTPGYDPWTDFLIQKKPALLSVIFLILIFGMPFVISFLAFNQISGDIQNHGLRYLLLRTERCNIFFGRFIGTALFSTAVMAIIIATITFYLGMKTRLYPAPDLTIWALQGFLALSILMVPYIAVCSLISASVNSPFLSLVLAKVIIAGVLLTAILGSFAWKPAKYILYALPWGWQNNLLHPALAHWLVAVFASLAYTAFFLALGYIRFETRDL
ncbi:MAG: ABC transporter permease subunit [Sedimentisphaerales bacterium]|nr:ABC transporter permease subunit [Sedimentisphaerales bacterium]